MDKIDLKEQITKTVEKITNDKALQEQFKNDPVKALESILGIDLPQETIDQVIQAVKAKLAMDKTSDMMDSLKGFLKKN